MQVQEVTSRLSDFALFFFDSTLRPQKVLEENVGEAAVLPQGAL